MSSSFSEFSVKPGAIKSTNHGIKISIIKIKKSKPIIRILYISFANFCEAVLPFVSSAEYRGTNAALKVPSENNLLKVFGILKATKNASAIGPEPRYIAIKTSLK